MQMRAASIGLLFMTVLATSACRTRLPVEPAATTPVAVAATQPAERATTGLAAFLNERGSAEQTTTNPLRPFLAEVKPDRLQDMVRMELLTDRRRGPLSFLTECACVCVPGQDH